MQNLTSFQEVCCSVFEGCFRKYYNGRNSQFDSLLLCMGSRMLFWTPTDSLPFVDMILFYSPVHGQSSGLVRFSRELPNFTYYSCLQNLFYLFMFLLFERHGTSFYFWLSFNFQSVNLSVYCNLEMRIRISFNISNSSNIVAAVGYSFWDVATFCPALL